MNEGKIARFFETSPQLAALCQQNGWPDADTLRVEVGSPGADGTLCSVSFEEILMEGSGCVAGRLARWGQFLVQVDTEGNVREAKRL
ncbi:MAG: hypothetical protein ACYCVY_04195 [Acidiferrobacteraceae bacterium]